MKRDLISKLAVALAGLIAGCSLVLSGPLVSGSASPAPSGGQVTPTVSVSPTATPSASLPAVAKTFKSSDNAVSIGLPSGWQENICVGAGCAPLSASRLGPASPEAATLYVTYGPANGAAEAGSTGWASFVASHETQLKSGPGIQVLESAAVDFGSHPGHMFVSTGPDSSGSGKAKTLAALTVKNGFGYSLFLTVVPAEKYDTYVADGKLALATFEFLGTPSTPGPTPAPSPGMPAFLTRFTDDINKFSIDYPSDWSKTIYSSDPLSVTSPDYKLSLAVKVNTTSAPPPETVEDFASFAASEESETSVIGAFVSSGSVTVGGQGGFDIVLKTSSVTTRQVSTIKAGNRYRIRFVVDDKPYTESAKIGDDAIASFKFLP